jgi:hypothetical protein
MEQIVITSTRTRMEEFKDSTIWLDISNELNSWKKGFEQELKSIVDDAAENNPSTASVLLHLGDLNGRIKAVDYMLSLPTVLLEILKEREEEERKDEH